MVRDFGALPRNPAAARVHNAVRSAVDALQRLRRTAGDMQADPGGALVLVPDLPGADDDRRAAALALLGLPPGETDVAAIRQAFARRARLTHPDLHGPNATAAQQRLNAARDLLLRRHPDAPPTDPQALLGWIAARRSKVGPAYSVCLLGTARDAQRFASQLRGVRVRWVPVGPSGDDNEAASQLAKLRFCPADRVGWRAVFPPLLVLSDASGQGMAWHDVVVAFVADETVYNDPLLHGVSSRQHPGGWWWVAEQRQPVQQRLVANGLIRSGAATCVWPGFVLPYPHEVVGGLEESLARALGVDVGAVKRGVIAEYMHRAEAHGMPRGARLDDGWVLVGPDRRPAVDGAGLAPDRVAVRRGRRGRDPRGTARYRCRPPARRGRYARGVPSIRSGPWVRSAAVHRVCASSRGHVLERRLLSVPGPKRRPAILPPNPRKRVRTTTHDPVDVDDLPDLPENRTYWFNVTETMLDDLAHPGQFIDQSALFVYIDAVLMPRCPPVSPPPPTGGMPVPPSQRGRVHTGRGPRYPGTHHRVGPTTANCNSRTPRSGGWRQNGWHSSRSTPSITTPCSSAFLTPRGGHVGGGQTA